MDRELLRKLPRTDALLSRPALVKACERYPYAYGKETVQAYLSDLRGKILDGAISALPTLAEMEQAILTQMESRGVYSLRRVINATGIILHTNLGRSPLGDEICAHISDVAKGYSNLEFNLAEGKRGSRYDHIESLLCELTGAEAAMVVNNNAGAVFLMLNTLAKGKRVAISRGELVEIGGAFRVPEIMEQSGAELVEVGTTNKTRLSDYETAISEKQVSVLLKVHTSNFVMEGFTEEAALPDMVRLGHAHDCPVLYDAGAAFLFPPELMGIHQGTVVKKCVECGADAVSFSADKLLGLAQAGVIVGKRDCIERMKQNPVSRMLRIDKLSLAALEAGLQYYKNTELAKAKIPVLAMAAMSEADCRMKAERLAAAITKIAPSLTCCVVSVADEVGGGSLPGVKLPGAAVRIECTKIAADALEAFLREQPAPIIGRIHKDGLLLSTRTLFLCDEQEIADAFTALQARFDREATAK